MFFSLFLYSYWRDVSLPLSPQLAEKERQLEVMEKENEKTKSIREAEERLIATAFYNYVSRPTRGCDSRGTGAELLATLTR